VSHDVVTETDKAIVYLNRAVALIPTNVAAQNNSGNAFLSLAELSLAAGEDPTPHAEQATQRFRKAIDLRHDFALPHYNIAYTKRIVAQYHVDHDGAILRARLALLEAHYAATRGTDPRRAIAQGMAMLRKAGEIPEATAIEKELQAIK
jgi:tetratricopeptide (TPR) repeat protein